MIVTPKHLTWLKTIFTFKDTAFNKIIGRVGITTALACVVTYLHLHENWFQSSLTPLPFSFIGLALSIFLGFRNSTSYDRFWEGRKLWGQLVNSTRSFSRQVLCYLNLTSESLEERQELEALQAQMHDYLIAYVHAFRLHLRDEDISEIKPYISEADFAVIVTHANRPNYLVYRLSQMVTEAWHRNWLDTLHVPFFEDRLHELSNLQGGCERIKATPIPFMYIVLLHRLVAIYCFALPFGIVDAVNIYTPFVVAIVSYAFLGLDAIGDSIENPFEKEPHDLPLTQISKNIEKAIRQQQDVPYENAPPQVNFDSDSHTVVL